MNIDLEKEVKYLKAINRINHAVGSTLELENICDLVVKEIKGIINCDGCAIILIDKNKVSIPSEIGFFKSFKGVEFNTNMPAIRYVIETKKSILTDNTKDSSFGSCVPKGCLMRSMICAPIIVKDKVKGIIHIDSLRNNAFSKEDGHFIETLTNEISVAVERSLKHEVIKLLSIMDKLTGVFNRRKFDTDLEEEINKATRYKRNLSLLIIDIDWFKKYNDFHGHQTGDEALVKVGKLFKKNVRMTDKVYRYGGEEFAIICCETDSERAFCFANRVRESVSKEEFKGAEKSQPNGRFTISIGCSTFPDSANNKKELIKKADEALYRAKAEGRNRVCTS